MGDHFVLLVDRLLTESTLEAAIEIMQATSSSGVDDDDDDLEVEKSCQDVEFEDISTPRKMVECRICQDEDVDLNMEAPCSCCGSLKYAHRRCVQKWCNEKGNTTCEICHQQFKPGYTAPPPLFHLGRIPINLRGNRDMSRRDMRGPRFVAVVSTDHNLSSPDYDDHSAFGTRHLICCRSIAILVILSETLLLYIKSSHLILLNLITFRVIFADHVTVASATYASHTTVRNWPYLNPTLVGNIPLLNFVHLFISTDHIHRLVFL
ncbi:E3 ubiquitin-protein ligase MARCHF2 [Linum perenne]